MDFNELSEKPQFIYKRNPLAEHSYQIFRWIDYKEDYEPVGEYLLLETDEDPELTEKKVMNVIALLNGKEGGLLDLGELTKTRVLFNVVPKKDENDPTKIIFRNHGGEGTSEENAILTLIKGVLKDG